MQNGLLVYGDIGIDIHIRTNYQPKIGEDAQVENILFKPGGSASNCAAVAAQLGVPTTFIGFIGKDYFGRMVKDDLKKHGVSTRNLLTIEGDTGVTIAVREPLGERTFYSYRGVNSNGKLDKISSNIFRNSRYLHLSGYSFQNENSRNNALHLINKAKQENVLISLDPSYWYSREFHQNNPKILSDMEMIFPNREEARLLCGSDDPENAAKILLTMGPKIVIIKLGSEGCYIASERQNYYLPVMTDTEVIDSTGAGDAFCGGFLFGQTIGLNLQESATIGNLTSSIIINNIGGHSGTPTYENLIQLLMLDEQKLLVEKINNLSRRIISSQI